MGREGGSKKKESKEDEEEMYRVMIWREKESKESKELRSK